MKTKINFSNFFKSSFVVLFSLILFNKIQGEIGITLVQLSVNLISTFLGFWSLLVLIGRIEPPVFFKNTLKNSTIAIPFIMLCTVWLFLCIHVGWFYVFSNSRDEFLNNWDYLTKISIVLIAFIMWSFLIFNNWSLRSELFKIKFFKAMFAVIPFITFSSLKAQEAYVEKGTIKDVGNISIITLLFGSLLIFCFGMMLFQILKKEDNQKVFTRK
ncbi:hypothetical protein K8Q94_00400 [Candidatus Nomurabacteria bacterium]|nr:hypothetical protein [Candidatus Nomurabacteria bacterium]